MPQEIILSPVALSKSGFSPYGDVIQKAGAQHFPMNAGKLERYYDLADIQIGAETGGKTVMSIARCRETSSLPLQIDFLERHPLGSQAIYPLFKQSMIVVVAPAGEQIKAEEVRAFYTDGQQGINFHARVWHLPIIALEAEQEFMLIDRGDTRPNCDEFHFESGTRLILSAPPAAAP